MGAKAILLLALLPVMAQAHCRKRPHIVFIMADDMGWGDVTWSNISQIKTPNLEALKRDGVELTQFYTQPKCTAARAALMTGRYPFRMGLQTKKVFSRHKNNHLNITYKLLPNYLQDAGYETHIVGKWHLGHCNVNATPTYRGFRSFFGAWGNTKDYFYHAPSPGTYEWIWNNVPYFEANGTYNTFLITNHSVQLLNDHFSNNDTRQTPIFLYVPYLAPHEPTMAPEEYRNRPGCANISDSNRRTYCGMMAAMDEGVGIIVDTLRQQGVLDDTIVFFTSDNGAALNTHASPWPLRGNKQTIYDGGTRVRTLMLARKFFPFLSGEYDGLMHITDVLPTLVEAAGIEEPLGDEIDGISAFEALVTGRSRTDREWMVYNIDSERSLGAIRFKNISDDFKLVYHNKSRVVGWRAGDPRCQLNLTGCDPTLKAGYRMNGNPYRLFNMAANPEEREPSDDYPDAALEFPSMFEFMLSKLENFTATEVPIIKYQSISKNSPGKPKFNNGAWGVGGC